MNCWCITKKSLTPAMSLCVNPPAVMKINPQDTRAHNSRALALPRVGVLAAGETALALLVIVLVLIHLIGGN